MSRLIITAKTNKLLAQMPHKILISGHLVGILRQPSATIMLPPGVYHVTIQSMVPLLSASTTVQIRDGQTTEVAFRDREKVWDALFCIDIVLWVVKRFLHLPVVWTWVYEILTNGFFVAWLIYEWCIRKKYFALTVSSH